ncbi:MAG: hypothetical protein JWL77_2604 [Chthonomonadaceae bacterium]|nr:hypothetical protein [Chthonomonadaceae bacterium]
MKKPSLLPIIMLLGILLLLGLFVHGLFENDAEVKLFNAAGHGDTETVERLVNEGVDVDGRDLEWYPAATPLTNAAISGHTETVKFLINHHANAKEALHQAIERHQADIVRVLKAAGAKE